MSESSNETITIVGTGSYAPEAVLTNADWEQRVDTTDEWIVQRTGIRERRVAADSETSASMADAAARAAIEDAGLDVADLEEIIIATDTPEVVTPDTASFVQHSLGAREVPAYDLAGSGCAGFLQALDVARSRILAGKDNILVVGVELISRLVDQTVRETAVLFGDAAGAAIVGRREGQGEILAASAGTDGSQAGILTLEAGGSRVPISQDVVDQGLHKHLVMDGRAVFRHAVARMSEVSREVLEIARLTISDVKLAVPHQANLRILRAVASNLGLDDSQLCINVDRYGNTGSASVPLALDQARRDGRIRSGDHVLLTSFGAGFHWAAAVVRF